VPRWRRGRAFGGVCCLLLCALLTHVALRILPLCWLVAAWRGCALPAQAAAANSRLLPLPRCWRVALTGRPLESDSIHHPPRVRAPLMWKRRGSGGYFRTCWYLTRTMKATLAASGHSGGPSPLSSHGPREHVAGQVQTTVPQRWTERAALRHDAGNSGGAATAPPPYSRGTFRKHIHIGWFRRRTFLAVCGNILR